MHPSSERLLELNSIVKTFRSGLRRRRVPVLKGIDLHLKRGEIFALLGPNGAGKTTLMKVVLGLIRPSAGIGSLLGRPLGDLGARRQVGYQPEQPYLYPALSVGETLDLLAGLSRLDRAQAARRIPQVVEQCALAPYVRTPVRKLSRGWLQRLTLAGALLADPQVLFLDEPLGGLDPEARLAVKDLIGELRAAGRTIMINSHILPDIEALADRIALLREGRIIAGGSLAELLAGGTEEVELEVEAGAALPAGCRLMWRTPESGRQGWRLSAGDGRQLQRLLAALVEQGTQIYAVHPRREGLESFFARAMARDARGEGAGADLRAAS